MQAARGNARKAKAHRAFGAGYGRKGGRLPRSSILRGWHRKACVALSSGVALAFAAIAPVAAERYGRLAPDLSSAPDAAVSERIRAVRAALEEKGRTVPHSGRQLSQWYNFGNFRGPMNPGYGVPPIYGAGPPGYVQPMQVPQPYVNPYLNPGIIVPQQQVPQMWRNF